MFFPRGGSSHVARALAHALPAHGWDVTVVSGSLPGGRGDAAPLLRGPRRRRGRLRRRRRAAAPVLRGPPRRARPRLRVRRRRGLRGARRRVGARRCERGRRGRGRRPAPAPPHAAARGRRARRARRARRDAPARHRAAHARAHRRGRAATLAARRRVGRAHAPLGRRRPSACSSSRRGRCGAPSRLLGVDPARCVVAPNGFDPATLRAAPGRPRVAVAARPRRRAARLAARARRRAPSATPTADVEVLARDPVLLARRALHGGQARRACSSAPSPARRPPARRTPALVLVGGYPGEWEGEHPWDVVRETGARDVFLAGWHDHDELPELLCGADALALASVARAVRLGARRGDGLRPAAGRGRPHGPGGHRRRRTDGLARRARRRGGPGRGARPRCWPTPASARAGRSPRAPTRWPASRGRRSARGWRTCSTSSPAAARPPRPRRRA